MTPALRAATPGDERHARGSRAERLAFWINAYNHVVAEGIARLCPRDTVWDVPDLFDRIGCEVEGRFVSASAIEHGVLRDNRPHPLASAPPFDAQDPRHAWVIRPLDPRIHCAISCGARSCPPVRSYAADRVDGQLDAAARAFVVREVALDGPDLVVSELFRWFAGDFTEAPGGLAGFLRHHLPDGPVRQALAARDLDRVRWRAYDWRLAPAAAG